MDEFDQHDLDGVDVHCTLCTANDPLVTEDGFECASCGCEFSIKSDRKDKER